MSGLTIVQTVAQSTRCHPTWTISEHVNYLMFELGYDPQEIDKSLGIIQRTITVTQETMEKETVA